MASDGVRMVWFECSALDADLRQRAMQMPQGHHIYTLGIEPPSRPFHSSCSADMELGSVECWKGFSGYRERM